MATPTGTMDGAVKLPADSQLPTLAPPILAPAVEPTTAPSGSSNSPYLSPPLPDARPRGGRPDFISRTSAQSLRTTASSSVHSIPEEGLPPPIATRPEQRRGSILAFARPGPGAGAGNAAPLRKARQNMPREGYEMGVMGGGQKSGGATVYSAVTTGAATKEDLAMAKWRKWAVDQPALLVNTADNSPLPSRKTSLSIAASPYTIHPPSGSSFSSPPPHPASISPSSFPSSSRSAAHVPDSPAYPEGTSSRSHSGSDRSDLGRQGPRMLGSGEIYLTETMRALQDVELAVDEDAMQRSAAQARQSSRLLSNQPRLSDIENPFMDIASRLSSRRIRPIVLELVHALGHYIFSLWSLDHPNSPCPWIIPPDDTTPAPLLRGWGSRTITAVAGGCAQGLVLRPSETTLSHWRSEVEYGLRDVTEAVGRWKKKGLVFQVGLEKARYGEVEDDNVLGKGTAREGGNIARLLNDLEEVLWGDALPRSTDLSFVLPADFDPYAVPTGEDLLSQPKNGSTSSAGDVFGPTITQRNPFDPLSDHARAVMDEVHAMPDLVVPSTPLRSPGSPGRDRRGEGEPRDYIGAKRGAQTLSVAETNQGVAAVWVRQARASFSVQAGANGGAAGSGGGDSGALAAQLTLEEVGRMRHEEWLANQRK